VAEGLALLDLVLEPAGLLIPLVGPVLELELVAEKTGSVAAAAYKTFEVWVTQLDDAGTLGWYGMLLMAPRASGGCV
jgi:hypothetical protein